MDWATDSPDHNPPGPRDHGPATRESTTRGRKRASSARTTSCDGAVLRSRSKSLDIEFKRGRFQLPTEGSVSRDRSNDRDRHFKRPKALPKRRRRSNPGTKSPKMSVWKVTPPPPPLAPPPPVSKAWADYDEEDDRRLYEEDPSTLFMDQPQSSSESAPPLRPHNLQENLLRPHSPQENPLRPHSPQENLLRPHSPQENPLRPHSPQENPLRPHSPQENPLRPHCPQENPLKPHSPQENPLRPHSPQENPLRPHSPQENPQSFDNLYELTIISDHLKEILSRPCPQKVPQGQNISLVSKMLNIIADQILEMTLQRPKNPNRHPDEEYFWETVTQRQRREKVLELLQREDERRAAQTSAGSSEEQELNLKTICRQIEKTEAPRDGDHLEKVLRSSFFHLEVKMARFLLLGDQRELTEETKRLSRYQRLLTQWTEALSRKDYRTFPWVEDLLKEMLEKIQTDITYLSRLGKVQPAWLSSKACCGLSLSAFRKLKKTMLEMLRFHVTENRSKPFMFLLQSQSAESVRSIILSTFRTFYQNINRRKPGRSLEDRNRRKRLKQVHRRRSELRQNHRRGLILSKHSESFTPSSGLSLDSPTKPNSTSQLCM